jgi:cytochrome d ubiquinol oxidase subunit I
MDTLALMASAVDPLNLLCARWQMALTLGAHIMLAVFGVGMPVLLLAAEWRWLATGDAVWRELARRWSKVFAVLFAVGAVSGTVLSFELGLFWPEFMGRFGAVFGLAFTLEGFAFFLEAIFVGIYLYGWERLPPRVHWWTGVPIALSGAASAWFVVTVNAWMNVPRGLKLEGDAVVGADPIAAMFNPATPAQTTHMLLAAYMVTGFSIAAVYAWRRLRGDDSRYTRSALALGLAMGTLTTLPQLIAGDWLAKTVARTQPVKLAAMEGQFRTEAAAPLRLGGWPDEATRTTPFALEAPGLLSLLCYGDTRAVVRGLDDFPAADRPPVVVVHAAFQLMVVAGGGLLVLSAWVGWNLVRRRALPTDRCSLAAIVACGPAAMLALLAGWTTTEVGRQPWIVQHIARTADMVSESVAVPWVFGITIGVYLVLLAGTLLVLRLLARVPLAEAACGP